MLRIAIVGCGKIADQHVQAISRLPDCQLVAVCDNEVLMAEQLAERFRIGGCYSDINNMLVSARPDVVHITTPPQSHFSLAQQCLTYGAHVYLEKPFTVDAAEAIRLVALAERQERLITAGHNYQFMPEMCTMRDLVERGFLGDRPVHLESYFSYDLGDASYVGPLVGNRTHWVRKLPGQLLQNIISHGIARLAEFLTDELSYVTAHAKESPRMLSFGGKGIYDELRVLIEDSNGTTAFFCFSSQIKPAISHFTLRGHRGSLTVDQGSGSIVRIPDKSYKSYLSYVGPPLWLAREHFRNTCSNMTGILRRRLYQDFGMKELTQRFYTSIRLKRPPPIPYREIILTTRIMDEIFAQIYPSASHASPHVKGVSLHENQSPR